jgi:hypothetical protein
MFSPGLNDNFLETERTPYGKKLVLRTPEESLEEEEEERDYRKKYGREYRSRKPWKWMKKRREEERGYNAPYQGMPGPSYYRPGPTGRRGYAGDEMEDEEFFSSEGEEERIPDDMLAGEEQEPEFLHPKKDDFDDYSQYSDEDYEEEFRHTGRMYKGKEEYRLVSPEGSERSSSSSRGRPSLYEPLDSGDDRPKEGLGRLIGNKKRSKSLKNVEARKKVIDDAHRALCAHYAASRAVDSRMSDRKAASVKPVSLKASAQNEIVKAPNKVIVVNEEKFDAYQRKYYNRSDEMIKQFKANAIEHMRGLLGKDFSRVRNPNVRKEGSVLIIGDQVRLAPYIFGDKGSADIKVTETKGFPSLKKDDNLIDSGYVLSVISKDGATVHGSYGGAEGKLLTKGQSFYYSELMVKTPRDVRKPEWLRAVSMTPSMITATNTSRADMDVRRISLFEPSAEDGKTFEGKATRILTIERLKDARGRPAKKVNSFYEITF